MAVYSNRRILIIWVLGLVVGVAIAELAFYIVVWSGQWVEPIRTAHSVITENFVLQPDEPAMQAAAIHGMVNSLEDDYSIYISPEKEKEFYKQLTGNYVGIGAEVTVTDGYLTIITPMEGSPALQAGVMAGDTVLEIEGETTLDQPINESIQKLLGKPGTQVTISVRHSDGREESLTITRRPIVVKSIRGLYRSGEEWSYEIDSELNIAYVRVTQFVEETVPSLRKVLRELDDAGLNGLILDLRYNGGGALSSAIAMSDLFLDTGGIVSIRGRAIETESWSATPGDTLPEVPMAVLINQGTASASEIVSGALKENGRAKLLGSRTFGKGSVQDVYALGKEAGTLKLTTGRYYLPSGRNLDRASDSLVWGVDPDPGFYLEMTNQQYQKMYETHRQYEIISDESPEGKQRWSDPKWIADAMFDLQLAAALKTMQAKIRDGQWVEVGSKGGSGAALVQRLREATASRDRLRSNLVEIEKEIAELEGLASRANAPRLLPADAELTDGRVEVVDNTGDLIREFRIIDPETLEATLRAAPLEVMPDKVSRDRR